jgi:hypothetical protein
MTLPLGVPQGLSGEYTRWQASIGGFRAAINDLVGDCLVASAFLSYAGPFDTTYREAMVKKWLLEVRFWLWTPNMLRRASVVDGQEHESIGMRMGHWNQRPVVPIVPISCYLEVCSCGVVGHLF